MSTLPAWRTSTRSLLRAAGVLLLLLGVVAMHQLAGGAHRSLTGQDSSPHVAAAPVSTAVGPAAHAPPHPMSLPVEVARTHTEAGTLAAAQVVAAVGDVTTDQHGGMPTCLAVLTGLLVLALPVLTQLRPTTPDRLATRQVDIGPSGREPPRDLLTQLCVLRP